MAPTPVDALKTIKTYEYDHKQLANDQNEPGVYYPAKYNAQVGVHHPGVNEDPFNSTCLRKVSNWSKIVPINKFDKSTFNATITKDMIPLSSPKLKALFDKITEVDAADMKEYGRLFKHFIFTDVKEQGYGAKIIASAFISMGYDLAVDKKYNLKPASTSTKDMRFGLLCSTTVYEKPIGVKAKKALLGAYNERPGNSHGYKMRFIILDNGFKEGIDLFDVKYVHLFEPLVTAADQKQAIGRATRFCGQKGIEFHPTRGWPLFVFRYDVTIPANVKESISKILNFGKEEKDKKQIPDTLFQFYMERGGFDMRLLQFAAAIEELTIIGAVDRPLTKSIHGFSIGMDEDNVGSVSMGLDKLFGIGGKGAKAVKAVKAATGSKGAKASKPLSKAPSIADTVYYSLDGSSVSPKSSIGTVSIGTVSPSSKSTTLSKLSTESAIPADELFSSYKMSAVHIPIKATYPAPHSIMNAVEMRRFVLTHYSSMKWPPAKMEDLCSPKTGGASIVEFSPTQNFIRNYFHVDSAYKGLLAWSGIGTGKTCQAIATGSTSFQERGYTILYVTRHTLKSEVWKNMFGQVCNVVLQEKMKAGLVLPDPVKNPSQYISGWLPPISFKQFTNMLLKKNQLYKDMVKINGEDDVLKKTLVIIDEAHKMYDPNIPSAERPDVKILSKMIHNSYEKSGKDSVRMLVMTATPYTSNPMDIISLINLLKPTDDLLPTKFEDFTKTFLDSTGKFTKEGSVKYLNAIAGYVSYLNREKDARQFAYPIIKDVIVPMSINNNKKDVNEGEVKNDKVAQDAQDAIEKELHDKYQPQLDEEIKNLSNVPESFKDKQDECNAIDNKSQKKTCLSKVSKEIKTA